MECEKCTLFTYGRFLDKKTCAAAYYVKVNEAGYSFKKRGCNCIYDPDLSDHFVRIQYNNGREIVNYKHTIKDTRTNGN